MATDGGFAFGSAEHKALMSRARELGGVEALGAAQEAASASSAPPVRSREAMENAVELFPALCRFFVENDCSLTEVNPLVVTGGGQLLCLDAKVSFDDNAMFRHESFDDLRDLDEEDPAEVQALTGLSAAGAEQAMAREGSEPLVWEDDDAKLQELHETLRVDGLRLTRGGRFWHVMGAVDKGQASNWLVARFEALRGYRPRTIGLGDGPNDLALLAATDMAVVIAASHGQPMPLEGPQVYRTRAQGPAGWSEGVSHWLTQALG